MEFSVQELRFAHKYPFSGAAKLIVKDSGLSLEDIPRSVVERASKLLARAFLGQDYRANVQDHSEVLRTEILAFPVSKILISIIDRLELNRKYLEMMGKYFYENLLRENTNSINDIAMEMKLRFELISEQKGTEKVFRYRVALADYLKADHDDVKSRLVNQNVSLGRIILSKEGFARLLSDIACQDIKNSLPLDVSWANESLALAAKSTEKEFSESIRKNFSKTDFGQVMPEAFPPCMSKIYSELVSGINVSHMGRFAMATFLNTIGMTPDQLVEMYRQTPNFNEKVTRYQVERIAGTKGSVKRGYSCPSCDKMRSYNLCVANCPVSHPVRFYERELKIGKPQNAAVEK